MLYKRAVIFVNELVIFRTCINYFIDLVGLGKFNALQKFCRTVGFILFRRLPKMVGIPKPLYYFYSGLPTHFVRRLPKMVGIPKPLYYFYSGLPFFALLKTSSLYFYEGFTQTLSTKCFAFRWVF